ncbi:MAG: helix-turn-helix transcriptional regulator [Desulfovibrio sp.]|nr:helix-turn-helix transcriptional regulator [Desulfovibrio sp.]
MIRSNLKEIMERLDVTYKQLEEKTGVSSQTITRARGAMISECRLSTLETIAQALGVTTKDLYDEENQKK